MDLERESTRAAIARRFSQSFRLYVLAPQR
jgi:hypothetical protein